MAPALLLLIWVHIHSRSDCDSGHNVEAFSGFFFTYFDGLVFFLFFFIFTISGNYLDGWHTKDWGGFALVGYFFFFIISASVTQHGMVGMNIWIEWMGGV
jgi:hypothetical protein